MIDVSPLELVSAARQSLTKDIVPLLAQAKREGGTIRACLAVLAYAETLLAREDAVLSSDNADMRELLGALESVPRPEGTNLRAQNRALRQGVADLYRRTDLTDELRGQMRELVLRQAERDYSLLQPVETLPPI